MAHPSKPNPWLFFFVFSISNAILSYFPFSILFKGWVLFLGIALPSAVYFIPKNEPGPFQEIDQVDDGFPFRIHPAVWVGLVSISLLIRFSRRSEEHTSELQSL